MSRLSDEWRHLPVPGSFLHVKVCTFRGCLTSDAICQSLRDVLHVKVCTFRGCLKSGAICQSLGVSYTCKFIHFETVWRVTTSASPWECLKRESMNISRLSDEWRHLPVPGSVLHVKVWTFRDCLTSDAICQSLGVSYTWKYVHFETVWRVTPSASPWEGLTRESMYISRVSDNWRRLRSNCVLFQLITSALVQKFSRLPLLNRYTPRSTSHIICMLVLKAFFVQNQRKT